MKEDYFNEELDIALEAEKLLKEHLANFLFYWVDAKVSADFFSFLCFKFLLKQNTINQRHIYHCYL